ncbi:uncharacterized protein fam169aa isoform X2 [Hemibagrus wyckioides]|uniref:uncharacterized protein fam169aa isoform X2 n=1 Tax=Hemibagrus wyckioides TaxID=337641 RepID=UPI00266CC87A|nr:uncharacterized protein fam169aa isoform X2 [Hemibagrus wyckioides]
MEFPVDILANVDPGSLEQSAKSYMSKLLFKNLEVHEYLNIPGSKNIEIGLCNVSFVPLYGVDVKQKILALFSPDEPLKAVGLYLLDQWWSAEDILKTADSSRTGLIKVRTPGERIVLYVLNRIIYRMKEVVRDDVLFPCHGEDEIAKILWKNGEAIGFYSVKAEGSLCPKFLTHRYQIPVMDTIFIRKDHRGHGHGLHMLEDFIVSYRQEIMGLSCPLSPAMYKVCKKYLSLHPGDTELLWEIVDVGSPFQRTQIARKLQAMDLKGNQVMGKLNFDTEDSDIPKEVQETMEFTEEEVVQIKITKDAQDTPVTTLGRSSNLKRKKLGADTGEKTEKIIRVEDIETYVQCAVCKVQKDGKMSLNLKDSQLKDTMETLTHDSGNPISDITHLHCEVQNKLSLQTTHQSETKMMPVMEIQGLKSSDLQPLECQQVIEVEIVKMSLETEEVKEKAGEVKESKDDIEKDILSHGRETFEGIVEVQKDQTDMADTINKEDIEDEVEMGKKSVVENIVDDTEETEVEKEEAGAREVFFLGKEQSEQDTVEETGMVQDGLHENEQETEYKEPAPDNEEEKFSTMIQQEENSNVAYSSGSKRKYGDKCRSNYETPPRRSRRLNDQAVENELTERDLQSSYKKTISKQVYSRQSKSLKQPELLKHVKEPKVKGLKQTESQLEKEQVEETPENENVEVCCENPIAAHKENEEGIVIEKDCLDQLTTDDETSMGVDNKMDVNNAEASEPSNAEHFEEQEEEPASAEDGSNTKSTLKWQTADIPLVESIDKQQVVEMSDNEIVVVVEDKNRDSNYEEREVRLDKIEEIIISKDKDKVPEPVIADENKIEEAQEEEPMKEPNMIQSAEPKIMNIVSSLDYEVGKTSKDEKKAVIDHTEVVRNAEIEVEGKLLEPFAADAVEKQDEKPGSETGPAEEDNSTVEGRTQKLENVAVTLIDFNNVPLKHESRLKHRAAESEITERVLRSCTKAGKANSKTKAVKQQVTIQLVDDPKVEHMKNVLESLTETAVEENIELVSITTETEHEKAVELEVEEKTLGQCGAEPVEECEEEPASVTGPEKDDDTEEATSNLIRQKVAVVLMDSAIHMDAGNDVKGTSQLQEEVDLELHKQSTDTESQVDHTEKEQAVETDETVESEESDLLNDEDRAPKSAFNDDENTEETDTVQEIPGENPKSLHLIESSEDVECELSDVLIKLDEEEENEAKSVTPLRRSIRLKDQAAGSELTKSVLRRSARLTNKATPQQRHKQQIKAMMQEPKQDESQNNDMNIILGSEFAVGEHMEPETVPKNEISVVQGTCEEGVSLEKENIEADDYENIMSIRKSHGDDVEENIRREDVAEQDKMAPEDTKHGEAEQICTSEYVKEGEDKIQEDTLTLQKASVVLVDVIKDLPNLTGEFSSAFAASQEESNKFEMSEQAVNIPEEVTDELQTEAVEVENMETESVNPSEDDLSHLNPAAQDTAEDERSVVMNMIEDEATDTSKLIVEKYIDESKVEEESKTEQFILQDPVLTEESDHVECLETAKLATDLAPEEDMENAAKSTSMLKLHQVHVHMDDERQSSEIETDEKETTQKSQENKLVTKDNIANEEKVLTEMNVTENVTERIEEEEDEEQAAVVELGFDNTLITNDEQVGDSLAKEDVKDDLKEIEDTTLKVKSTSTELDTNKTLVECQESITPAQGDSVQESRNFKHRTVPVMHTQERKSGHLQNIYKGTKINENTEEESSDEEVETVFTRHLRGRTVTVTPRRSKRLTVIQAAEMEMEQHVTNVCHEIVAVQGTEETRTAVEETCETNSKYDSEEIPSVSEAERKDQNQDNDLPGNDAEKVEGVTDGRKAMVGETVDHKEVETKRREILVEVDLPDENQEKEVRSANSKQESDQQDHALEETLLEKTFEKELSKRMEEQCLEEAKESAINIWITDQSVSLDQSEEGKGVERRALRERTITIKPTSVRKSKRLTVNGKQDHGQNDGQTVVWANTEDSAPVEATVIEMTDVQSHKENKTTDQGKGQEIKDTNSIGGEISQDKTYGDAENSQENTETEDKTEFLCVSTEDTHSKIVAQEEEKVEENRKKHSATEDIMESGNNAGKSEKVADKPQEVEDTQEESEKNVEEMPEAQITLDETFTLELDEEIDNNECNQVVEETKASFQESEKEITDTEQESGLKSATASPGQRSARRRRGLLQDFQSEMEDKSKADEVKDMIGGKEEKKPHQKRKPVDELTPRRSKRLARAEIV